VTFEMFLERVNDHPRANMLYDPSHYVLQQLDYLDNIDIYNDRIKMRSTSRMPSSIRPGVRASMAATRAGSNVAGRFRSLGDGQVDFGAVFSKMTSANDFDGWAVVEWECALKHPEDGAREGAASIEAPSLFSELILVSPSPRYIDDDNYVGGFAAEDIEELLAYLAQNQMGWAATMAPTIMGNADRPELSQELEASFCRSDPAIAAAFARVTFTSDNRPDLAKVRARTLVLQCKEDAIAPIRVGEYVRDAIADSELVLLDATGHCPNLSAPEQVIEAISAFV
jgi:pimeloyl-ACP methyl ester carboxylesterase